MASPRLKRKLLNGEGAVMGSASGSYGSHGGVFGLLPPEPSPRDGRKRRIDKLSWVKHTFTPYFDGHFWLKYGQKFIKDSPFPRLYFRCSYREDRRCLASKLMQQENHDDPPLFTVTYSYQHTCNAAPVLAPDVVAEAEQPAVRDGFVLSFGSSGCGYRRRDARMRQERQQCSQPAAVPPSPFLTANFNSSNSQLHEQAAFPFDVSPAATASAAAAAFDIIKSTPAPPSANDEGGMLSTWEWDSLLYSLEFGRPFALGKSCAIPR